MDMMMRLPSKALFIVAVLKPPTEQIFALLAVALLIAVWRASPLIFKNDDALAGFSLMFTIVEDMYGQ